MVQIATNLGYFTLFATNAFTVLNFAKKSKELSKLLYKVGLDLSSDLVTGGVSFVVGVILFSTIKVFEFYKPLNTIDVSSVNSCLNYGIG